MATKISGYLVDVFGTQHKIFHASTVIRRCRNQILKLKSGREEWISGRMAIGREFVDFFEHLFTTSDPQIPKDLEDLVQPLITREENVVLKLIPDAEEIFTTRKKNASRESTWPQRYDGHFFHLFLGGGQAGCCQYYPGFFSDR